MSGDDGDEQITAQFISFNLNQKCLSPSKKKVVGNNGIMKSHRKFNKAAYKKVTPVKKSAKVVAAGASNKNAAQL